MQTIYIDISNKSVLPTIYAKQGDVGRKFEVVLTDSGLPYIPAGGSPFSVWYSGESGDGNYTEIGGRSAFSVNGNKVTVEMIAQMLSNEGDGILSIVLNDISGNQIGLWNVPYICEAVPGSDSEGAKDYYTAFSKSVEDLSNTEEILRNKLSVDGSNSMTADLPMGGHKVTGLSEPVSNDDAINLGFANKNYRAADWRPTIEEIGAAPDGYGLGTQNPSRLTTLFEVDNAGNSGWYEVRLNGENIEGLTRGLLYVNASALVIEQVFAPYLSLCKLTRYWNVDYGWNPWEWENPPMSLGVEYRTTERWNDKVVYAKSVNVGTLPNTAQKTIEVGIDGSKRYEIHGHAADHPLSHGVAFPSNEIAGYIDNEGVLHLTTTGNYTSYDATVTIKYVKD